MLEFQQLQENIFQRGNGAWKKHPLCFQLMHRWMDLLSTGVAAAYPQKTSFFQWDGLILNQNKWRKNLARDFAEICQVTVSYHPAFCHWFIIFPPFKDE